MAFMKRRHFLHTALATALGASIRAEESRPPRILLRSSWQVVNIGDIAHTPGVLALIEKHLPQAEVMLWASADMTPEVAEMEHRRFPKLRIVKGTIGADGKASNADLEAAIQWTDFLLHGSGPALVAARDVAAFIKHTGKPYGVYGITHGSFLSGDDKDTLSKAKFIYFRDTLSLEVARKQGIRAPIMEFSPDGAFACDLRDDAGAQAFMAAHGLEEGKFLCCIPRLRYTPYWKIRKGEMTQQQRERAAYNEEMKEQDNAPLRKAIIEVVRGTDLKVLVCPEDFSQVELGKEILVDPLPAGVRERVVWRDRFWLTDEALSTYVKSVGLFGLEMHSPIMCIGNGVPAMVCRFKEQTSKGYMWRTIGLGDWLFDFDVADDRERLPAAVLAWAKDRDAARQATEKARAFVMNRFAETMKVVGAHSKVP
jgi:hypothetical protein